MADMLTSDAAPTSEGASQQQPAATAPAAAGTDAASTQQATGAQAQGDAATPPADAKPDGQADGAKDGDKPTGAPENYEDFKAPEGAALDAEVATEFKGLAKELNLSQDAAQKVADLGGKLAQKWAGQQTEAIQKAQAEWINGTKTDKEIGGDQLPANLAVAKKALDTFGTPELRTLLNESGLGNHPEIIRAFYRAGKAISEDRVLTGGATQPVKTPAKTLFPNQA
jgi:hypothetical protein